MKFKETRSMNILDKIYREIEQLRDREAILLWRLARKAAAHGCSKEFCDRIRNEGWKVKQMYPDHLINPFNNWEFAFRAVQVCSWEVIIDA